MVTSPFVVSNVANSSSATGALLIDYGFRTRSCHAPPRRSPSTGARLWAHCLRTGYVVRCRRNRINPETYRSAMPPMGRHQTPPTWHHRGGTVGLMKSKGRSVTARDRVRPYAESASHRVAPMADQVRGHLVPAMGTARERMT